MAAGFLFLTKHRILINIKIFIYNNITDLSHTVHVLDVIMGTSQPGINGHQNEEDHSIDQGLAALSLSSKTIHADDYLNKGRDVAPPLHVSTTFRYNRDPDALQTLTSLDVSSLSASTTAQLTALAGCPL
jgi:hypothetical protein